MVIAVAVDGGERVVVASGGGVSGGGVREGGRKFVVAREGQGRRHKWPRAARRGGRKSADNTALR